VASNPSIWLLKREEKLGLRRKNGLEPKKPRKEGRGKGVEEKERTALMDDPGKKNV